MPPAGFVPSFGWVKNPREVARIKTMLAIKTFHEEHPHLVRVAANQDVMLWLAEEKLAGRFFPPWDQGSIGSCVAHGWGRALQDLICVQAANSADKERWPGAQVCREAIYGGARIQIGHDGGQDGAVGAWAAAWLTQYGGLFELSYPGHDLTGGYTVERCREWGDAGCPSDLEPVAKQHGVKVASVQSSQEAADAIAAGKPIAICGDVSRTMRREPGGWCPQTGNDWPHCQEIMGSLVVKGGAKPGKGHDGASPWSGATPALVYRNSWGDYLGSENSTVTLASGQTFDLPAGCYLSTFDEADPDFKQGDSFALCSWTPFLDGPPTPPGPGPSPAVTCATDFLANVSAGMSATSAFVLLVECLFKTGRIDRRGRNSALDFTHPLRQGAGLPWASCLPALVVSLLAGTPPAAALAQFAQCMMSGRGQD